MSPYDNSGSSNCFMTLKHYPTNRDHITPPSDNVLTSCTILLIPVSNLHLNFDT